MNITNYYRSFMYQPKNKSFWLALIIKTGLVRVKLSVRLKDVQQVKLGLGFGLCMEVIFQR